MSRCFPYPPPGYCRNGATYEALIESIKLQKETDKAKAERRKEKREKKEKKEKKKNEKEKRKNDEKVNLQKNRSQDSHKLQKVAGFTEAEIKGTKTNAEVLEKSDLSEEHGQPVKPSYSSDSTQNSNKRRRDDDDDDVLLHDDSTGHGKPIKIRFLKKQKGSDSSNSGNDARLKTVPFLQPTKLDRTLHVSSNRNDDGVPATSGRENNASHGIPLTQSKSNTSLERTKNSNPNGLHHCTAKPILPPVSRKSGITTEVLKTSTVKPVLPSVPRRSGTEVLKSSTVKPILPPVPRKSGTEALKSSRQQIESFVRPVVSQGHLEHEKPSSSVSRNIGVQGLDSGRQKHDPSNLNPGISGPVSTKPNPTTTGKRPIDEIAAPHSSRPAKLEKKKEVPKKPSHTRAEKKLLKKHAKYEKLIGSWAPPVVVQALVPVVDDDEDWLCRRTKAAKPSTSTGEVETCREYAATSLWQPQARFLADADIHALPYTVPF
ncbi:hypothetical protein SSX86_017804 [Deinandra increscens subsp. villosa]|uniref:Uncharacterized protein n=1 Tax=Deinandra increscens subsp. villosa TaxID=3103831 RepID=A0AAP0D180_9ASTR